MKEFSEATRVQMPAMVHLTRLGYKYYGKISEETAGVDYDPDTNILLKVFREQFKKLNPEQEGKAEETLRDIRIELDNDDLGRSFYKRLTSVSPVKLVDFEHPENNEFHCTGEFTCKRDQDEFRPGANMSSGIKSVILYKVTGTDEEVIYSDTTYHRFDYPDTHSYFDVYYDINLTDDMVDYYILITEDFAGNRTKKKLTSQRTLLTLFHTSIDRGAY